VRLFHNLRDCQFHQRLGPVVDRPVDRRLFRALCIGTHDDHPYSVACVFRHGNAVCAFAVAIELNRHRCSHARYVQRGHCLRNAESLDHSDMCSLRYELHKKLCNLTEPSNR
jgi:hypothetical protein